MSSKEVTDRARSAGAVIASIEAHGAAAGGALEVRLKRVLKRGEEMPDLALALTLFGRALRHDSDALVAADDAHQLEKQDDDAPRTLRDASAAKVREACVHARDGVMTVYGPRGMAAFAMAAPPPPTTDGHALVRWAKAASERLDDEAVATPPVVLLGVSVDRGALSAQIREHLGTLRGALGDVERERRELETTQAAKDAAMARSDETFSLVANVAAAVLDAAGMHDQAAKVRPSIRRPGRVDPADPVDDEAPKG